MNNQIVEIRRTDRWQAEGHRFGQLTPLPRGVGVSTMFRFPLEFFRGRRAALCAVLQKHIGEAKRPYVFLKGGVAQTRYDTDRDLLFRQEDTFWYLTGIEDPDFYALFAVDSGVLHVFAPHLPEDYAVWLGAIEPLPSIGARVGADEIHYCEDLKSVLSDLKPDIIFTSALHTHPDVASLGAAVDDRLMRPAVDELRVFKTPEEISAMREACRISSTAHIETMKATRPGMKELEVEALYKYHSTRLGGRFLSFEVIAAAGKGSATLHYMSSAGTVHDGDTVQLDAGAEYNLYAGDITRVWPASGKFTPAQAEVYQIVLNAQMAVINAMKPGVFWPDMHRLANRVIGEGLLAAGFIRGPLDEAIKNHVPAYFMPHGLGHLIGLAVHDVGGYPPGTSRVQEPGIRYLRCGRHLAEGMCITVEPGIYFIKPLLDKARTMPEVSQFVVWEKVDQFKDFGGVRIEDDVLITKDGIEILTSVPKEIADIEKMLARE